MNMRTSLLALASAALAAAGFTSYATTTSAAAVTTSAAPLTLTVDAVHSTVIFKCKHANTSWSFGRFNQIDGKIQYDAEKPEASSIELTIPIESIDTAHKDRDAHLRHTDFFSAAEFPNATFKSKSVTKKGDKNMTVVGDLTIKGVTKPLTLDVESTGKIENH